MIFTNAQPIMGGKPRRASREEMLAAAAAEGPAEHYAPPKARTGGYRPTSFNAERQEMSRKIDNTSQAKFMPRAVWFLAGAFLMYALLKYNAMMDGLEQRNA